MQAVIWRGRKKGKSCKTRGCTLAEYLQKLVLPAEKPFVKSHYDASANVICIPKHGAQKEERSTRREKIRKAWCSANLPLL